MPRKFDYKPLYNLTNRRFGKLTVMKYMGYDMNTTGRTHAFHKWLCKCDCGNTKIVQSRNLLNGHCQSCGCLAKNPDPKYIITHGKTNTRLYDIWKSMKGRCYTPSNSGYKHYGARGIQVCDEWRNDFNSFYEWSMNSGYNPNAKRGECTIERIDVNGNYEPDNCKWVNMIEQANNKTSTKKFFIGGEYLTLREISTNCGIPYKTLRGRIDRGADIETAVYGVFDTNSYLNYNGKELSIMKWSEITGIKPGTIHNRLRRGWDVEKTLCTPVDTSCWNTRKEKKQRRTKMINGMFHREMKYHGKQIIIDACEDGNGYEIMVMYSGGKEIESTYTDDLDEAEKIYNGYRFKYENQEEAELKGRYAELRDALIKAVEAGKEADYGEDGGTCNFDAPSISMPRAREKLVKQAAKEAGISCFKWNTYGDTRWVFSTPTNAQGNRNCRVSEAMCKALTDLGYSCLEYCSLD